MAHMFSKRSHVFPSHSIAVDLGTANTRIYAPSIGKITEKPSLVCLVKDKTNTIADAYFQYINSKLTATPLRGGVIVDFEKTVTLLRPLIKKSRGFLIHPVSLACAPTDTTERERHLLARALTHAGASRVFIIPEVWAAAMGAGLDLSSPTAQLLIDIGDGVTDMAVFRDGRIIFASAVRTACSDLQKAVRSAILIKYKTQLHAEDSERLTHEIAGMFSPDQNSDQWVCASGIDLIKRDEVRIKIKSRDIVEALLPVVNKMMRMVEIGLKKLPENIYCEILESGICLTGGGACISGLGRLIAEKTLVNVKIAPDPIHAVINGTIAMLDYWKGEKSWWENLAWPKIPS
jgi:rod shape-determining protein MreB